MTNKNSFFLFVCLETFKFAFHVVGPQCSSVYDLFSVATFHFDISPLEPVALALSTGHHSFSVGYIKGYGKRN